MAFGKGRRSVQDILCSDREKSSPSKIFNTDSKSKRIRGPSSKSIFRRKLKPTDVKKLDFSLPFDPSEDDTEEFEKMEEMCSAYSPRHF